MLKKTSTYAHLYGPHDYNRHPFAPVGCAIEAYLRPTVRDTWAAHSALGFSLGTSFDHYRCHRAYISDTRAERICDTLYFRHKYLTMPRLTPADNIILAAENLQKALEDKLPKGGMIELAVKQLMNIFKAKSKEA